MKKMSLTDIKNARKWALPAGIVALGFASVALGQSGIGGSKSSVMHASTTNSQAGSMASSASKVNPKITVNGKQVPTDRNGSTSVDIPGGKAKVDVSDGQSRTTTSENGKVGTSNTSSGNVNVHIDSQSSGGTTHGTTHISGFSTSSGNSNHSTTNFRSHSNVNVSVTH